MRLLLIFFFGTIFIFSLIGEGFAASLAVSTDAASANAIADKNIQTLRTLLKTTDAKIDLANAKIAIDRMIDPNIDAVGTRKKLNVFAARIKARFPIDASPRIKLNILLSSLYQPGPWNDFRPFSYDFNDPFGKDIRNKFVSTYLVSRKGNCVSMPVLFVILGQKLDLDVTLATAPEHVLVKYRGDDGQWLNVEATGGGFKRDSSYQRDTGISEKAMANHIYLRPLTKRESVAVMMSTMMEFYVAKNQQTQRVALADLALEINPKDTVAMIHKATGYYMLLQLRYVANYPSPADIPPETRKDYLMLSKENLRWFANAEALGWTEPTKIQNAKYLDTIEQEKIIRQERN